MEPEANAYSKEKSGFPAAFAAGAVVMLLVLGGFILLTRATRSHGTGGTDKLPFDAASQAYAQRIHFADLRLSQSSNLLNQEFVYVNGTMSNDGDRTIRAIEVTVEFHDPFNQVILRDTPQLILPPAGPLPAGQTRDFQITILQHLPSE